MLKAIFSFFIAIVVIILGVFLAVGAKVYRTYASMKKSWGKNSNQSQSQSSSRSYNSSQTNSNSQTNNTGKQVIGDDEGEYVDFEEVKSNEEN